MTKWNTLTYVKDSIMRQYIKIILKRTEYAENIVANIRNMYYQWIKNNIISEMPDHVAACEYCGRKNIKPRGCDNIGTLASKTCKYGDL